MNYETIYAITHDFYQLAIKDILIGYHFRVIPDFATHIPRIANFWHMQIHGKFHRLETHPFNLVASHLPLKINSGEINRWTLLFSSVLEEYVKTNKITLSDKKIWEQKIFFLKTIIQKMVLGD
jgi:hemoglobin